MKQAIIIRKDLGMKCGKIAGQAAHASLRAVLHTSTEENIQKWLKEGETKIVLKVRSEEELLKIITKCTDNNIECAGVKDLGKTQIPKGTLTSVAIGPYDDNIIDCLVGDLKLL